MEALSAITSKAVEGSKKAPGVKISTSNPGEKNELKDIAVLSQRRLQNSRNTQEIVHDKIERIAEAMDSYVRSIKRDLKIQVHNPTGKIIVKVISSEDGKVIREIPPRELLDLAAKMERMTGILFNENA